MNWLLDLGLALGALAAVAAGLTAYGARRWAAATLALQVELEEGRTDRPRGGPERRPTRYDVRELEGLPAPVQRYFRAVLSDGQPMIEAVTIAMAGRFNLSATGERWRPFTSNQHVITRRPGFLWDARISLMPGLCVRVVDSYVGGLGRLQAALQGVYMIADLRGGGDIARDEFMRYFAEAAWYPTALLPSQGVRWQAVDDHAAEATMEDGPLVLHLLFSFNEAGLIDSFRAESRGSRVGRNTVSAPWEGRWSTYRMHDGVLVPHTGEVAWIRPQGRRAYFMGSLTSLRFEHSG